MNNDEMPDYWAVGERKAKSAESGGKGIVIYSHENGWKEKVTAERPTVRNHNPANLWYGHGSDALKKAKAHGALTVDKDGFAVFPDWLTGKRAAEEWWEDRRRDNKTIGEAVDKFLAGDKPAVIKKRKSILEGRAHGYADKHGRPVDRNTRLSDLTVAYRSYPSYEASMEDYLSYLQGNPRYAKMFEPDTRESLGMLADAIDHAGYRDDPLYTFRILGAAQDPVMKPAVWQYRHWPPGEEGPDRLG